jgi:saccharopine dehydrogenase (NAD+, L-lysine forming)
MKIGIIKEGKIPEDKRVPFTPQQILRIQRQFKDQITFVVEPSPFRCYKDEEYQYEHIPLSTHLEDCDILMGIKEVPLSLLIPNKTYFFFSHTIKKQSHNRMLLQEAVDKNITLIDYEALKDEAGERLVAFGKWAGIVGAYNGLWTYGQKTNLYHTKRAKDCFDYQELLMQLNDIQLPPIKIVVTGTGRVAKGVMEILDKAQIKRVDTKAFLNDYFDYPVYTVLSSSDYARRKTDGGYDKKEFFSSPEIYESHFLKYAEVSDMLFAAAYWDSRAPKLFELKDIQSPDFAISVIADITCDINGSVPTTSKTSSVNDPVYDVDRESLLPMPPFQKQNSISVMAIDNLPSELPRNASEEFGEQLIQYIIPELFKEKSNILEKATIAKDGDLTLDYIYLQDYISAKE